MANDELGTPRGLYDALNAEFGFQYDAACTPRNALAAPLGDGLGGDWPVATIWCNPPYSKPAPWVTRAIAAAGNGATVVMLLQADTSTSTFYYLVNSGADLRFVRNRLRFVGSPGRARFASVVAVLGPEATGRVSTWELTREERGFDVR